MSEPIQQLPEGYAFVADQTVREVPAGHRGRLPDATGTVERFGDGLGVVTIHRVSGVFRAEGTYEQLPTESKVIYCDGPFIPAQEFES